MSISSFKIGPADTRKCVRLLHGYRADTRKTQAFCKGASGNAFSNKALPYARPPRLHQDASHMLGGAGHTKLSFMNAAGGASFFVVVSSIPSQKTNSDEHR